MSGFAKSRKKAAPHGRPDGRLVTLLPPYSAAAPRATLPPGHTMLPPPLFTGPNGAATPSATIPTGYAAMRPPPFPGPPYAPPQFVGPTGAGAPVPPTLGTSMPPGSAALGPQPPPAGSTPAVPSIAFSGPPPPTVPLPHPGAPPLGAQSAPGTPMGSVRVGKLSEAPSADNIMRGTPFGNPYVKQRIYNKAPSHDKEFYNRTPSHDTGRKKEFTAHSHNTGHGTGAHWH